MADFFIFQPPYVYFILIGLVFGVGYGIFRKVKSGSSRERFHGQSLNEVLEGENLKPYAKHFGRKIKGKLISNLKVVNLRRVAKIHLTQGELTGKTPNGKNIFQSKHRDFYVFQSGKSAMVDIPILNKIFGKSEFFIIDDDENKFLVKDKYKDTWTLTDTAFLHQLGGVWVCSDNGQKLVTELVYKKIYENLKEEDMNYPKRVVWYNDQYAYNMTGETHRYLLERKKWQERIENETGVKPAGAG